MQHPSTLDPATRIALEALYSALLSAVVVLARVLGRANPIRSRSERREDRNGLVIE